MFSSHEHARREHGLSVLGISAFRTSDIHSAEIADSPELEGDFEGERHRAAAFAHEKIERYEHGEGDGPVIPATLSGYTHP